MNAAVDDTSGQRANCQSFRGTLDKFTFHGCSLSIGYVFSAKLSRCSLLLSCSPLGHGSACVLPGCLVVRNVDVCQFSVIPPLYISLFLQHTSYTLVSHICFPESGPPPVPSQPCSRTTGTPYRFLVASVLIVVSLSSSPPILSIYSSTFPST
ncbi:hypothetical protein BDN71DRAFT_1215528 [Pleurotus eryngii]|uniref:Uncharacterized protein n=1 Tax=Pleurotus eryngii TaxID=5323 RepID=A0A9P5ZRF8_PLEER|nr:hypothetical protein BDN71DRAFT_1215528 [Pleurotus eryngii]